MLCQQQFAVLIVDLLSRRLHYFCNRIRGGEITMITEKIIMALQDFQFLELLDFKPKQRLTAC